MPIYEYEAADGQRIEELCFGKAPNTIRRHSKVFRRIVSLFNSPNIGANVWRSREKADEKRLNARIPPPEGPLRDDLPSSSEKKRQQRARVLKDLENIRASKQRDAKISVRA